MTAPARPRLRSLLSALLLGLASLTLVAADPPPTLNPTILRTVGGPGHAGLYGWGATTMLDGSVLIGDYWNKRVQHYATDGTLLGSFIDDEGYGPEQHQSPYGLGVDPRNGDVYMADTDRRGVDKYDASGNYLLTFGTQGDGPNQFRYPSRVAVASDGTVFVADTWHNKISAHTDQGVELFEFGGFGSTNGKMKQPHGMAFDDQDRLFVVDTNNHRVQVFDASGTFLFTFGSQGPAPGQFLGDMRGLAIDDANDAVYVTDGRGNRIHRFTRDGVFVHRWGSEGTGPGQFSDGGRELTVDGNGNVWVGDMPNFRAQVFAPDGTFLFQVPDPAEPPAPGGFNGPRGVGLDSQGNLFVSDMYNWRIEKFDAAGTFLTQWGSRGRGDYKFNYARLLEVDTRDDSVLVADTDNHVIKRYDNDGTILATYGSRGKTALDEMRNPHGIDVGPDGRIYIADTGNDRVLVWEEDGTPVRAIGWTGTGPGGLRYPKAVALDLDGSIWVTDSSNDAVHHYDSLGNYINSLDDTGAAAMGGPFGIDVDEHHVFVADNQSNTVKVFLKDGTHVHTIGGQGTAPGKLYAPQGVAIGPDGLLYVSERLNDRISVFDPYGVVEDTTAPTVTVTAPAAGAELPGGTPVGFAGTADDDIVVDTIGLAIKDVASGHWRQADGSFASGYHLMMLTMPDTASASIAWSTDVDLPDGSYGFHVKATDLAGNQGMSGWQKFTVSSGPPDTTPPTTTITTPAHDEIVLSLPVSLTGTADDDVGVATVEVYVRDQATNHWLQDDLVTFAAPFNLVMATLADTGATSTSWSIDLSLPDGQYGFGARTHDTSGNRETPSPWRRFSVSATTPPDVVDPNVTVTAPAQGASLPAGTVPRLEGAASDDVAVAEVEVAIRDRDSGWWWNGTAFAAPYVRVPTTLVTAGQPNVDWSIDLDGFPPGSYGFSAIATDTSGNTRTSSPWTRFVLEP